MECSRCGKENAEYLIYCGNCGADLPKPSKTGKEAANDHAPANASEDGGSDAVTEYQGPDPLAAIAINVRRIALALILSIVVTLVGSTVTMSVTVLMINDDFSSSSVAIVVFLWLGIVTVSFITALIYIITNKRLTVPNRKSKQRQW